jgi:hypothetical protein|tara:strand:+ start:1576 stop:1770 length:195 start_codon:yes stop_codon:yes gene_type:complete
MGCGCKKKKNGQATTSSKTGVPNTQEDIQSRREVMQEQKTYQTRVQDALKQLMDIKKNKQRIKR